MNTVESGVELEQSAYRMLSKTFMLLDDFDRRFFAKYGLSTRQYWALQHLDEHQGRSMIDISRLLLTDKSNVTGIIDYLERLNFVVRTPSPHDRRVILITITPEGLAFRNSVTTHHMASIRELMDVVEAARLHNLLTTLGTISQNLETNLSSEDTA